MGSPEQRSIGVHDINERLSKLIEDLLSFVEGEETDQHLMTMLTAGRMSCGGPLATEAEIYVYATCAQLSKDGQQIVSHLNIYVYILYIVMCKIRKRDNYMYMPQAANIFHPCMRQRTLYTIIVNTRRCSQHMRLPALQYY